MANINLYQSIQEEKSVSQKKGLLERGFLVVIMLLVFSLAVWGGLKGYNILLNKKIINLDKQIAQESSQVESAKMDKVADFQERLDVIKASLSSRENPSVFFSNLEKAMVQGVILKSCEFKFDKDKKDSVSLIAQSDSYTLLAQQVQSLKKTGYFEDVALGQVTRDQEGKIEFEIKAVFENPVQ